MLAFYKFLSKKLIFLVFSLLYCLGDDNTYYNNITYSVLARDSQTGTIGGVATTGSYCVGGWVLRGDVKIGMSASQGASASTILGDQMIAQMNIGENPDSIIKAIQEKDQVL